MPLTAKPPSQDLVDLVGTLGGTWHGYTAMCRCPAHADREPSLSLRQGDRGVLVTCFAGCPAEDVLRELRRVRTVGGYPRPAAVASFRMANVQHIWDQATDVRDTLAERYLVSRHLWPPPPDLRFHPRCPYLPRPHTEFLPSLLIAVREGRSLVAIQRIILDPRTGTRVRKVMLGTPGTGAWRGRAGGTTLAIAEGFETAAAFTILHGIPCWASLGARRLDLLRLPSEISQLLIAEDNDAEGARAAARAAAEYARTGLSVRRMPPPRFKDWAKLLEARSSQSSS